MDRGNLVALVEWSPSFRAFLLDLRSGAICDRDDGDRDSSSSLPHSGDGSGGAIDDALEPRLLRRGWPLSAPVLLCDSGALASSSPSSSPSLSSSSSSAAAAAAALLRGVRQLPPCIRLPAGHACMGRGALALPPSRRGRAIALLPSCGAHESSGAAARLIGLAHITRRNTAPHAWPESSQLQLLCWELPPPPSPQAAAAAAAAAAAGSQGRGGGDLPAACWALADGDGRLVALRTFVTAEVRAAVAAVAAEAAAAAAQAAAGGGGGGGGGGDASAAGGDGPSEVDSFDAGLDLAWVAAADMVWGAGSSSSSADGEPLEQRGPLEEPAAAATAATAKAATAPTSSSSSAAAAAAAAAAGTDGFAFDRLLRGVRAAASGGGAAAAASAAGAELAKVDAAAAAAAAAPTTTARRRRCGHRHMPTLLAGLVIGHELAGMAAAARAHAAPRLAVEASAAAEKAAAEAAAAASAARADAFVEALLSEARARGERFLEHGSVQSAGGAAAAAAAAAAAGGGGGGGGGGGSGSGGGCGSGGESGGEAAATVRGGVTRSRSSSPSRLRWPAVHVRVGSSGTGHRQQPVMSELPSARPADAGAAQTASAERSRHHASPSPPPPPPPPPLPRLRRPLLHELLSGAALVGAASHSHLYRRALARLQLRCADVSEDDALRTGMWLAAKSMLAAGHAERAQDTFMCCKLRSTN